jgi:hypothetical protein
MYLNEPLFSEFIANKEIMWLGVDFSKAVFTKTGFDFPVEVLYHYCNEWNMLIISDQKKYDIRMAFRKPVMHYDLSFITKKNKSAKLSQLLVDHVTIRNQFSEEQIIEYVKELSLPTQTRFSLLLLTESFDQKSKTATIWAIIIENNSSEVALCEKFMEEPSGFGLRNYWGRTFYNLFFNIQKRDFLRWTNLVQPDNLIK